VCARTHTLNGRNKWYYYYFKYQKKGNMRCEVILPTKILKLKKRKKRNPTQENMGVVGLAFVYFINNRRFWALGEKIINQITAGPSQLKNLKGSPVFTREMEERTGRFMGWLFDSFGKKTDLRTMLV